MRCVNGIHCNCTPNNFEVSPCPSSRFIHISPLEKMGKKRVRKYGEFVWDEAVQYEQTSNVWWSIQMWRMLDIQTMTTFNNNKLWQTTNHEWKMKARMYKTFTNSRIPGLTWIPNYTKVFQASSFQHSPLQTCSHPSPSPKWFDYQQRWLHWSNPNATWICGAISTSDCRRMDGWSVWTQLEALIDILKSFLGKSMPNRFESTFLQNE